MDSYVDILYHLYNFNHCLNYIKTTEKSLIQNFQIGGNFKNRTPLRYRR